MFEVNVGATINGGSALMDALADELVLASQILAELAFDLGSDDAILRRHMTSLQKIDHITQIQFAIVDVLRAPEGADALASVTLDDMAQRLRRVVP